jgi:UDP:flavonoid glycosyltransferase YjiC (YdhE family)
MARILIGWEMGSNFGHYALIQQISRPLQERGHEIVLALSDLRHVSLFFDLGTLQLLQAPVWKGRRVATPGSNTAMSITYADFIIDSGYRDAMGLAGLMQAWRGIFELSRPDLFIANAAPTALLASRDLKFARCSVDLGYGLPPSTVPLPSAVPWLDVSDDELRKREAPVVANVNQALSHLGLSQIGALRDVFADCHHFLTTYREFDHYGAARAADADYVGPLYSTTTGVEARFPAAEGKPRLFVYQRPNSVHFRPLLSALKAIGATAIIAAPGASEALMRQVRSPHIQIFDTAVRLANVLPDCDAVICAAGQGTVAASLMHGKPVLALPAQLEQLLFGYVACKTGAVVMPQVGQAPPNTYLPLLEQLLESSRAAAAREFQTAHSGSDPSTRAWNLCRRIEDLLPVS